MFNFLVTAEVDAWNNPGYEYDRGRFLEYTSDEVAVSFQELKPEQLNMLLKFPCLFAYEGTSKPMRVGRLQSVRLRNNGRLLFIAPKLYDHIPPIPFERIKPLQAALDIRSWELNRTHWAIKDEDLFEVLAHAGIPIPEDEVGKKVGKLDLPPVSIPGLQANSVGTFIEQVLDMDHGRSAIFYRGHSNRTKYRLEPSIFRKDERGNFIYRDDEDRIYRELLVSNSVDFHGDMYTLDRLVRMQHYSLPTRLLDITSNPLIALYFACKDNIDVDGEVIVFSMDRSQVKYFDSDTASCIANLARLSQDRKDLIDYNCGVREFNKQDAVKSLLNCVKEEKPFFESRMKPCDLRSIVCVKGKHTNSRISFQSGAFLLFGHDATLDENGTPDIVLQRIAVNNKNNVLKQLDRLNINESTVFPYIENSAKYIADKFAFDDSDVL